MRDEVLALFRELVDLSPEARSRYLNEREIDPDLRAEVESLLAYDGPGTLTSPVEREAKSLLQSGWAAGSNTFGPYRSIGVLGEGGMGIVYLAEQSEPVRRRVALKVIKHEAGGSLIARFESERQALALLDHPNVAKLFDAGQTADGRPWFAMEYVPGLPITDYCDANQLGLRDRLLLFQQVCRAVEHAHEKGIIHRDLKPSNILVAKIGGVPNPKIIDFGVAKAVNLRLTERTLFTEMGMLIGTPEYMSPEQAGDAEIGSATDIYSLGVVLYELLVGATPFDSKTLRRAGYNEICRIIRETDPPRPTTRLHSLGDTAAEVAKRRGESVAALARTLHGDLEWITMKALEKEPSRRYTSPGEFAADLERHLRHEPVNARAPSAGYRLRKLARRRRLELIAAGAMLLAIAAGAAAVMRTGPPPGPENLTQHRIELPGASRESALTDGRRVVFKDVGTGDLRYSNASGTRVILREKQDELADWSVSRDFSRVVLFFRDRPGLPGRLAVINTDGSGYRELWRGGNFNERCGLGYWSWDNRWFLFYEWTREKRHLHLISPLTGEHRELASWEKGNLQGAAAFSPDERFVAWMATDAEQGSQIFVMPGKGGAPRVVYQEGKANRWTLSFLDWTADGRYLIIATSRTGRRALYLVPIRDGQPAGDALFLRNAAVDYGYTTETGALIYRAVKPGSLWSLHVAPLGVDGRPGAWRKLAANLQNDTNPMPNWSPDSNRIVYGSRDPEVGEAGMTTVRLHDISSGEDHEVHRTVDVVCNWASRQPKIVCSIWGPENSSIDAISPDSGTMEHLGSVKGRYILMDRFSRDDKKLYYLHLKGGGYDYSRWDVRTGVTDVLATGPYDGWTVVSADERWLVRYIDRKLDAKPISGGEWRTLVASARNAPYDVTPDGNWVYYFAADQAGNLGLYRIATTGGTAERMGDIPVQTIHGTMRLSPDGRKVITATYDDVNGFETWSLENFVPAESKR